MSSRHPKTEAWERRLKSVFDQIDAELERKYGERYPLHPVRSPKGETSNPAHDGLFDLGAAFSAGYGSEHGPGYVVRLRVATLAEVPDAVREEMESLVISRLRTELRAAFPNRELSVSRDGPVFKIHGDLSLGSA
jgi:hypothetical protein